MSDTTPNPTPLSPTAQAVLDALSMDELNGPQQLMARAHAAAALHAAADQPYEVPAHVLGDSYWLYRNGVDAERDRLRTIAAELDPQ